MRRRTLLGGLPAILLPYHGNAAEPLPCVASFTILADMLRQIGGAALRVTSLVAVDADPHAFEPRPADLRAIAGAALLVENGLGLEGWMARLAATSGFAGVRVIASQTVTPRRLASGTDAGADDPHAWQDPRNGIRYVRAIAEGLARADPAGSATFRAAAARFIERIAETDAWIEQRLAAIPSAARRIVTTHDAFGYYGARYGIELLAAEGLSSDAEPSARAVAALIGQIRREHITAVFLENMTDPRLARTIARETGAVLGGTVYADALSGPGGPAPSYLAMLRHNTTLFAQAMQPH
jgi:zinc/manganese transport system substrate-binding protein